MARRFGCDAKTLGALRTPIATQGRSYKGCNQRRVISPVCRCSSNSASALVICT